MRKTILLTIICLAILPFIAADKHSSAATDANPFFTKYNTPFETPPFDRIKYEHYMPAFQKGMEQEKKEVAAITDDPESPTFQNTIEPLERSGYMLEKVRNVLFGLQSAELTDEIQNIANEVTPLLAKHRDDINLNEKLFRRVKAVYEQRERFGLTTEQAKLLDDTYKNFVRGGANLTAEQQERFRKINEELSTLSLKFDENVLKETNAFKLIIDKKEDLAGLPQRSIDGAAEAAKKAGMEGKWVFTVQKPSMIPFLQYADNRALREKIFNGYISRGDHNNEYDNKAIVSKIATLRVERAHLLGYKTHADFVLERNMAKTPQAVYEFMNKLWEPALKNAKKEREALQEMINKEGGTFKLAPWDWWYYAEKVKKAQYDLDEDELRPYFQMENVRRGAFDVASRLYGIRFVERTDIPCYADDVQSFEVLNNDGSHIGVLFTDYYPRGGKGPGAWMGSFRQHERIGDSIVTPIVYNVGNFSRPSGTVPGLLSLDEVETLFHEFGHALFGLLSGRSYQNLRLPRDGSELPSQIMEHWAFEPEVLRAYARHYTTGKPIPDALVEKIQKTKRFNQGFTTVEYLAASFLDMDWHTLKDTVRVDPVGFEKQTFADLGLIPEIVSRYRSPYFSHIFSGGYSAGYYSYIWAEVLDAD
ncbi:MAG TPA: peptidase M3, partial [Bacteroidetes bacterium]|nr:peptidase M3 [Bacteroidota bacterium]